MAPAVPEIGSLTIDSRLVRDDPQAADRSGIDVAVTQGRAIIGSYWDDDAGTDAGSAYIFEDTGSGWTQVATLTASDATELGVSVDINAGVAIAGAYLESGSGSAYIFQDTGSGWSQVTSLTADDAAAGDYFGHSVGLNGNTAIIGAPHDDGQGRET